MFVQKLQKQKKPVHSIHKIESQRLNLTILYTVRYGPYKNVGFEPSYSGLLLSGAGTHDPQLHAPQDTVLSSVI